MVIKIKANGNISYQEEVKEKFKGRKPELDNFFLENNFIIDENTNYIGVKNENNSKRLICAYHPYIKENSELCTLYLEKKKETKVKKLEIEHWKVDDGLPLRVKIKSIDEIRKILSEELININKIAEIEDENIREVDREMIIKARIGQSEFRSNLLKKYEKCQICGLIHSELLVASHIKPWAKSDNKEKLDEFNGLLLCSQHDAIFDKGYISFEKNGNIKISKKLSIEDCKLLNIDNSSKILIDERMIQYLEWHRKKIFLK